MARAFSVVEFPKAVSKAFTLVELLVAITIIVVLLALLTPAIDRAMSAAEKTRCGSNHHALGLATVQYVLESRRRLPPAYLWTTGGSGKIDHFGRESVYQSQPNWAGSLIPFLGGSRKVFLCPIVRGVHPPLTPDEFSDTSYLGNGVVYGRALSNVAGAILLQEFSSRMHAAYYRPVANPTLFYYWHWDAAFTTAERYSTAHDQSPETRAGDHGGGGGNLLYTDGHVEFRRLADLQARDFGLTGNGVSSQVEDDFNAPDNLGYQSIYR